MGSKEEGAKENLVGGKGERIDGMGGGGWEETHEREIRRIRKEGRKERSKVGREEGGCSYLLLFAVIIVGRKYSLPPIFYTVHRGQTVCSMHWETQSEGM